MVLFRHGKTSAQVLLRYHTQRDVAVVSKSVNADRIRSNFDCYDFTLTDEDLDEIKKINTGFKLLRMDMAVTFKYYPFTDDYKE